jgi:hypothetical protein
MAFVFAGRKRRVIMKARNRLSGIAGLVFFSLMLFSPAHAGLDLAALPERTAATLDLTGPTAVLTEERLLNLKAGVNEVSFSWQDLPVIEDSIRLDIAPGMGGVEILSVNRPPAEPTLTWKVLCDTPSRFNARIRYGLMRIDGLFALRLESAEDEASCTLEQYVIVRNFSGEDFENLSVMTPSGATTGRPVRHGETIRTLVSSKDAVKIQKIWRYDSREETSRDVSGKPGASIPVYYRLENTKAGGLGERPVPGGKVRIFHRNEAGKTVFLGDDKLEPIHPGKHRDLYIGKSRDVTVNTNVMTEKHVNVRRNKNNRIVLYDTEEEIQFVVENFKDSAATVNLVYFIPGEWAFVNASIPWSRSEAHLAELNIHLEPGNKKEFVLKYHRRNVRP